MTKSDLISHIAASTGLDRHEITIVVEQLFTEIKRSLATGQSIYIRGFGTFSTRFRAQKLGRDIAKNTALPTEAHYVPIFKAGKEFRAIVRDGKEPAADV